MTEPGDVLDSGAPARFGPWIAAVVVAVLGVVGWNVVRSDSGEQPRAVEQSDRSDRVTDPVTEPSEPDIDVPGAPDHAGQLIFADAVNGFLVQYRCSQSTADDPCPRQLFATQDGGISWEARAVVPAYAEPFQVLHVHSELDLVLFDQFATDSVIRSFDGGRSWSQRPVARGEPAPAPAGAALIRDRDPGCTTECPDRLAWFDSAGGRVHLLPAQPASGLPQQEWPAPMAADGDLLSGSVDGSAALVSMSSDQGRTWTGARLEVALDAGDSIVRVDTKAAGAGRGYAFLQVFRASGLGATHGYRTDDGGLTWVDLHLQGESLRPPAGVLDGELIATDEPGRILVSSSGGREWAEGGVVSGGPNLTQTEPDGPVLATVLDSQAFESYWLSSDGFTWRRIVLPEV